MRKLFALSVILGLILVNFNIVHSQEKKKDEDKSPYQFTIDYEVPHTPVKNQAKTGTCWCFSTVSYLESEALRLGKGELNLSEMFVVRHTYPRKAESYVRLHGNATFGQGGQSHDVIDQIRRYGIVPENVYPGMEIGEKQHNHSEMFGVLKAILDGTLRGRKLTPRWEDAFNSVLDIYLGKPPVDFLFQGKKYTPKSFAENYLRLNFDDYVELTSYQIYPFYEKCRLEVPDNWTFNDNYYNVPINDLEKIIDHALKHGFSVVWDGDVSERDFSTRETGYAIVPEKDWEDKTKAERKEKITEPVKEKKVTQEMRELTFDNFQTTDDHLMHIVGLAHDQKGTKFYYTKNSAGVDGRKYNGYMYLSRPYVRLKTVAIMVNKNAIPKKYRKKLGL
ncbi:MAG: aminopeptidase [Calditrichaeota bacterium]|nr:aminopeptidase [Calditrichota bacterium]